MTKLIALSVLFSFYVTATLQAEDAYKIEKIINKYPILAINWLKIENEISAEAEKSAQRTDMLIDHTHHDLAITNNTPQYRGQPIKFESHDKSTKGISDYYEKIKTRSHVIFTWSFTIKEEGLYLIKTSCSAGSKGKLDGQEIVCDKNSQIIIENGLAWVPLKPGKHTIALITSPQSNHSILILNKKDMQAKATEIIATLEKDAGFRFFFDQFYPQLLASSIPVDNDILECLATLFNKFKTKCTNKEKSIIANSFWDHDQYETKRHYFHTINKAFPQLLIEEYSTGNWLDRLIRTRAPISRALYYSGQEKNAKAFFNAVIEHAEKDPANKSKELKRNIFVELAICNMHIGNYEEVLFYINKVFEISDKTQFPGRLGCFNNISDLIKIESFKPAHTNLPIDNVAESLLFEISDIIKSFDNSNEYLNRAWRILESIQDKLVLGDEKIALSLMGRMIQGITENKTFSKSFKDFANNKIKERSNDAIQENNYTKLESLFNKYGAMLDLAEVQLALFKLSAKNGNLANAIYHGEALKAKQKLPKNEHLLLQKIQANSGQSQIETKAQDLQLGSLWSRTTLPSYHFQYTTHYSFDMVQPAEIYANDTAYFITTPNHLEAISGDTKKKTWEQNFGLEYKQGGEGGPFQKRSILHFFGNSISVYGPSIDADNKAIYKFNTNGTQQWVTDQYSNQIALEPICAPIFAANKLFTFTTTKYDTIRVLYLTTVDQTTGKYLQSVPITKIPTTVKNRYGRDQNLHWNTYRHDEHFVENDGFIYAYTGTGAALKIEPISNAIMWLNPFHRIATADNDQQYKQYSQSASGYIKVKDNIVVTIMPDIQILFGLDKSTGKEIWKSLLNFPHQIHSRNNADHLVISKKSPHEQATLIKLNMLTGEEDWVTDLNSLTPTGEGEIVGNKILIPVQSGLLTVNLVTGTVENVTQTPITFDKVRFVKNKIALFSNLTVWIMNNDGKFNPAELKQDTSMKTPFIEPESKPSTQHLMAFPSVEASFQIPETSMSTSDRWNKTQVLSTSKPFYHIMKSDENISLINESFTQNNNTKIPPSVIWKESLPYHQIIDKTLLISKPGLVSLENLFTREIIWQYQYTLSPLLKNYQFDKNSPFIASDKKFIALQMQDSSIRILDFNNQKILFHVPFNDAEGLALSEGVLLVKKGYDVHAYDLKQNGKYLWKQHHNNRTDIYAKNGMFIYVRYSGSYSVSFYEIQTGKEIIKVKSSSGDPYRMVDWSITDTYINAYNNIYDRKTGSLIDGSKEACEVKNGGFLCFDKNIGTAGFYYENGKRYPFKLRGWRIGDNPPIAAIKKGNEIFILSVFFSERLIIEKDKLTTTEYITNSFAKFGSHSNQIRMDVYALDDSFLVMRDNEFSFIKDFSTNEQLNTFETYQASDDVHWPSKETYPETKVPETNWISKTGIKPDFSLHYQIGINPQEAFLKFRLGSIPEKSNLTHQLKIRTSNGSETSYITWCAEKWETGQPSHGLELSVKSWKQIDTNGNINLFVKIHHGSGLLSERDLDVIGQLGIEVASYKDDQMIGYYRIGGAAVKNLEPYPWKLRYNQHSNHLENVLKRENLYDQLNVLFPQGYEIAHWLTSRRKIYGTKSNIEWLNKAIPKYKENFAVVNFISALILEEIINNNFLESDIVAKSYKEKINAICIKVKALCDSHKIKQEWSQFALNVICLESYPNKTTYNYSREDFYTAVSGHKIYIDKELLLYSSYGNGSYDIEQPMYKPHLQYFLPGLLSGYPSVKEGEKNTLTISIQAVCSTKSNFGEMTWFAEGKSKTLITIDGKATEATLHIDGDKAEIINKSIYWETKQVPVYTLDNNTKPRSFNIKIPNFPTPVVAKGQGLTTASIKTMLDNLPTDSYIGFELIDVFKGLDDKGEVKIQDLMSAWLKILNKSSHSVYRASQKIYDNAPEKDRFNFMKEIWKDAKVSVAHQRSFMLNYNNIYQNKNYISFMGPISKELKESPIGTKDFSRTYADEENSYKFTDSIPNTTGGYGYWAIKMNANEDCKAMLLLAGNNYSRNSLINGWLNGNQLFSNGSPSSYSNSTLAERIKLKKGENILILRIDLAENRKWNELSLTIGDYSGVPVEGLSFESLIKEDKK